MTEHNYSHFPVIGLAGAAGAGKSEVGKILVDAGRKALPFSMPLKLMLKSLLTASGITERQADYYLYDPKGKNQPVDVLSGHSTRHALQTLGTEWGREQMHYDFWVNLQRFMLGGAVLFEGRDVVVDDVRFQNEADLIRETGGIIALVYNPRIDDGSEHESEQYYKTGDFDLVIHNDGTIEDLRREVRALFT